MFSSLTPPIARGTEGRAGCNQSTSADQGMHDATNNTFFVPQSDLSSQTCISDARRRQQPIAARRKGCRQPSHRSARRLVRLVLSQNTGAGDARYRQACRWRRGLLPQHRSRDRGLLRGHGFARSMDRIVTTPARLERRDRSRRSAYRVCRARPGDWQSAVAVVEPVRDGFRSHVQG